MQKDILNPITLGIDAPDDFTFHMQEYISKTMTEDRGYLNVVYVVQSNGRNEEEYSKSEAAKTNKDPFCIENTEGYDIDLNLVDQAPIPRYFLKTDNFDIFDPKLEVKTYRVAGEFVAHSVGQKPSFSAVLKQNVEMGFMQYEITGAWVASNLIHTVRKMLERGAFVDIKKDLIASDEDWENELRSYAAHFVQNGQLGIV